MRTIRRFQLGTVQFLPVILLISISGAKALRCFECVGVDGLQGFNQDCINNPNVTQAITSEACVRAEGVYKNLPAIVRVGIYRVAKGVPLSCDGQGLTLRVNGTVLSGVKYCEICDDQDGCNGTSGIFHHSPKILVYIGLISACYFYKYFL